MQLCDDPHRSRGARQVADDAQPRLVVGEALLDAATPTLPRLEDSVPYPPHPRADSRALRDRTELHQRAVQRHLNEDLRLLRRRGHHPLHVQQDKVRITSHHAHGQDADKGHRGAGRPDAGNLRRRSAHQQPNGTTPTTSGGNWPTHPIQRNHQALEGGADRPRDRSPCSPWEARRHCLKARYITFTKDNLIDEYYTLRLASGAPMATTPPPPVPQQQDVAALLLAARQDNERALHEARRDNDRAINEANKRMDALLLAMDRQRQADTDSAERRQREAADEAARQRQEADDRFEKLIRALGNNVQGQAPADQHADGALPVPAPAAAQAQQTRGPRTFDYSAVSQLSQDSTYREFREFLVI